ncbi:putative bifunctional diguanylate cyclase/phosphodiesterase [Alpinimonas psychrophila]|uniref:Diguanylate cyclase (GGDEF)-like protein n=2 Tax=Alpinimonas psychrophila TaxID=748908 RepID=A0A7W3JUX3_9MICO|nr:EAL domain-containing protein [Alpinimonas psychrophila]MBA8829721.1 diguanylate cyclase (GGDEF)-like protein [Alpinimonas psychrophila]
MTQEGNLSSVLTDFALTMASDIPVKTMVDELVRRICDILPIDGAAVTLQGAQSAPRLLAASSIHVKQMEDAQIELGEGPSVTAYLLEAPVAVSDFSRDTDYPSLVRTMRLAGLKAAFAFPLRYGDHCLGTLSLYRAVATALAPSDTDTAQTLADVTAAYLFNARNKVQVALASSLHELNATHDALTGLPNRAFLNRQTRIASDLANQKNFRTCVLFLDVDHLKIVNDSHGHAVGDELLVAVADRISAVLRQGDTLSRVSGDEFIILCNNVKVDDDVERLAARIKKTISLPFVLTNHVLVVSISIGIAISEPGETDIEALIDNADRAMYRAKRLGPGIHQLFDEHMDDDERAKILLTVDLTAAIGSEQIVLGYQPIIRNSDGLMTGVEALFRWTHPTLGYISATRAIALAEESGLIIEIGNWVLETACGAQSAWTRAKPEHPMTVSINVSAKQLMDPDFADRVAVILADQGTNPESVILEVTESAVFDGGPAPKANLKRLQTLGMRVSLDDFGTGYSTLTHLRTFTTNNVKIDQQFISDMANDRVAAVIVTSITNLAQSLGASVTAEGIETELQQALVIAAGADYSQGFLFGRAMSVEAILALL